MKGNLGDACLVITSWVQEDVLARRPKPPQLADPDTEMQQLCFDPLLDVSPATLWRKLISAAYHRAVKCPPPPVNKTMRWAPPPVGHPTLSCLRTMASHLEMLMSRPLHTRIAHWRSVFNEAVSAYSQNIEDAMGASTVSLLWFGGRLSSLVLCSQWTSPTTWPFLLLWNIGLIRNTSGAILVIIRWLCLREITPPQQSHNY